MSPANGATDIHWWKKPGCRWLAGITLHLQLLTCSLSFPRETKYTKEIKNQRLDNSGLCNFVWKIQILPGGIATNLIQNRFKTDLGGMTKRPWSLHTIYRHFLSLSYFSSARVSSPNLVGFLFHHILRSERKTIRVYTLCLFLCVRHIQFSECGLLVFLSICRFLLPWFFWRCFKEDPTLQAQSH